MMLDALADWGRAEGAEVQLDTNILVLEWTVAQRRFAGALRHLRYRLQMEADEPDRTVILAETLWERTPGRAAVDLGADLRERDEMYRVGTVWERTAWEAQSGLFRMAYDIAFDFAQLRHRLERLCVRRGYQLRQLIPL